MKSKELAKFRALENTSDYCVQHSEEFEGLPEFNTTVLVLVGLVVKMHKGNQDYEAMSKGFTSVKNLARGQMIKAIIRAIKMVLAYAGVNRTFVVPSALKVKSTALSRRHENEIADVCRAILSIIKAMADKLTGYGFTTETGKDIEALIVAYESSLVMPPELKAALNTIAKVFRADLAQAEDLANNTMNPLVNLLEETKPAVFNEYYLMRKVVVAGSRKLSLKCTTVDAATGEAVRGVKVIFTQIADEDGNAVAAENAFILTRRSSKKGGFQGKNMPYGTYAGKGSKPGYTITIPNTNVCAGELTVLEIKVTKK